MQKRKHIILLLILLLGLLVVMLVSYLSNRYISSLSNLNVCTASGEKHSVVINEQQILPANTLAKRCDTLVISNKSLGTFELAFGEHNNHIQYDQVAEETMILPNEDYSIILTETGTYRFHDHLDDSLHAFFTVEE